MGPIRNPNWSTSGMRVTLSYLIIDENNLHQIVHVPTREEQTLDLILVTNPSNINLILVTNPSNINLILVTNPSNIDLILVTNPSIINKVNTLSPLGLSDHDIVYTETDIWLRKVHQQPRKILKYDKANWNNIKSDLKDTLNKIININNDTKSTVNEMWNLFKNNLTESINKKHPT